MKTNQIRNLLLLVSIFVYWIMPSNGWASVEVNGIFYELDATEHKAMVSSSEGTYSGAIVIPESILYNDAIYNVTSIDNCAFEGCTAMTSLTIPSSVSNIGYYAFFRCEGLTSLYIPNGVTSIGDRAFANCYNLNSIEVDLNNTKYDSRNNCNAIIETESNKLVAGCKNTVLPNGIITIGSSAFFGCTGLASIEIPSSVTSIENLAFYDCSSLSSVIIPNSVTTMGEDAFAYCSGIEVMKVGTGNQTFDSRNNCNAIIETSTNTLIVGCKSTIIPSGVNTIGPSAFKGCGIISITIPNGVEIIEREAFRDCLGLNSVSISGSVVTIEEFAFESCHNLESVELNNGLKTIRGRAFGNCLSLKSLTIPQSVITLGNTDNTQGVFFSTWSLESIVVESGNSVFDSRDNCNAIIETSTNTLLYGCKNTVIPNSIETIGNGAFMRQNYLESIIIPEGVKRIGEDSFRECDNLQSITFPSTLQSIGNCAFIYNVNFRNCFSYLHAPIDLLQPLEFEYLYVLKGTRELYLQNEWWNRSANIIEMDGDEPSELDVLATGQCGDNLTYTIYSDYSMVISGTGEMWDYDYSCITPDYKDLVQELTIEEGVTYIGAFAFSQFTSITSLTIPNSVTTIGKFSFGYCPSLTSVDFGSGVSSIGNYAFNSCQGLVSLTIPDNVIGIDDYAFAGCSNLTSLTIGSGLRGMGTCPFADCNNLSSIIVDERNERYDSRDNCNAIINKVNNNILILGCNNSFIPDGVTEIGSYAFSGCTNITTIEIPNSVTGIDSWAFSGCTGLTAIEISNSVTYIGSSAFSDCTGLTTIVIPNSVTSISDATFSNCTSLTSVVIPNGVTNIWADAFSGCNNMSSIIVGSVEPPVIKTEGVFEGVDKSTCTLFVPSGSQSAYESADYWKDFANILEFRTEDDNPILAMGPCGDHVIYTVYSDMSMTVSGTGNMWNFGESWGFNEGYFHEVENVVVEEGVTSLGDYAFCEYRSSKSISLPNSLTSIGYYAFLGCTNLESLSIPRNVTYIGTGLMNLPILTSDKLASITVDPNNPVYDSRDNCNAIIRTSNNELIIGCVNTVIPNSVTSIGLKSFGHCKALTSIEIPNSVTSIGWNAFNGCSNLDAVTVPSSVTFIDSYAFAGTPWLANQPDGMIYINNVAYIYKGTMPEETSIIINEGTVSISNYAFRNSTNLISVEIPNSVTDIGNAAFSGCSGLTSITMKSNTPTTFKYTAGGASDLTKFYGFDQSACTLYVPYGSKSAYENAACWSKFGNIVEYDPDPDTDISELDNAIYMEQVDGRIGGTKDIKVKMKNDFDVRGFQFTMELPEGTTINSWTLTQDRLPEGTTMNKVLADGTIDGNQINVGCALNDGMKTFTGNDGTIATVNVSFAEDMEEGSYPIYLTHNSISDASGQTQLVLSDIKATLVLEDYVTGDTNGDGMVLIGDVITILNYIIGVPSGNFNVKAADVNGDGMVLIGDVIAVLNIIVNQ